MREIIEQRKNGKLVGIASYCTANELVLEACLSRAKQTGNKVLIEATANQVNQFGGYTGMQPIDFKNFVYEIADRIGLDKNQILLGGDHLGPLTWQDLPESEAMENSKKLVYDYVMAGFTKIHLDTSMRVASDPEILDTKIIASRGVELYFECMKAYSKLKEQNPDALKPVFIIGSEVPIPGGATDVEDSLAVTSIKDFENTIAAYKEAFESAGISEWMNDIIAVVVQPGVEFGDSQVFYYDSKNASQLCNALKNYPNIVFEGHSTDYQKPECLKEMVHDGIAILKVGPALTYAAREALFALSMIEDELLDNDKSNLINVVDEVMLEDPSNWEKHYHGTDHEKHLARKYSYSDRSRYYMGNEKIQDAITKLFDNLSKLTIPMNILHQYMPLEYTNSKSIKPKDLVIDHVVEVLKDYEDATII